MSILGTFAFFFTLTEDLPEQDTKPEPFNNHSRTRNEDQEALALRWLAISLVVNPLQILNPGPLQHSI